MEFEIVIQIYLVLSFLFQQEFEALHANFKPTWKRFKRSMANENYAKQFLKAVIVYNSDHIKQIAMEVDLVKLQSQNYFVKNLQISTVAMGVSTLFFF